MLVGYSLPLGDYLWPLLDIYLDVFARSFILVKACISSEEYLKRGKGDA